MSSTPASIIPISVDYTSKSYYEMRSELIQRIQSRIPEWKADDPSDFGVALVEAFAYMGDIAAFYTDRVANENFLETAAQRNSVLKIAATYGYIPSGYQQSFTTLRFTNTSTSDRTIPAGTVCSGDIAIGDSTTTLYFTLESDLVIDASDGVTGVEGNGAALEGRDVSLVPGVTNVTANGELIGTSNGLPAQSFRLSQKPVVEGSVQVYVQEGTSFLKWETVTHIVDYSPSSLAYSLYTDDENNVYISFGDGVSGYIPTKYAEVRVKYIVGGGVDGNISTDGVEGYINSFYHLPGLTQPEKDAILASVTVTQPFPAIGGSDPETTEQIRVSAPYSLRANNRAVTLQDYSDLALAVSGVGKANATANIWTSVTVYIAPSRTGEAELAPGYDGDPLAVTAELTQLKEDVVDALSPKILLGTTVTVGNPMYVDVVLGIMFTKFPQYTTLEVENALKAQVVNVFSYKNMNFETIIYPQDIEYYLAQVPGVQNVRVTQVHREGDTGVLTLEALPNELFRFTEENTTVTEETP